MSDAVRGNRSVVDREKSYETNSTVMGEASHGSDRAAEFAATWKNELQEYDFYSNSYVFGTCLCVVVASRGNIGFLRFPVSCATLESRAVAEEDVHWETDGGG